MASVLCFIAGSILVSLISSADIDYSNQGAWGGACNLAGSKKQSPIDVVTPETCDRIGDYIIKLPEGSDSVHATNANKEYTIQFGIAHTDQSAIKYTIPGKEATQGTALQLHLHWGASDDVGSEHQLDGVQHSAEMHMVTSYKDGETTLYAAVGRLFKVGDANPEIAKMITAMKAGTGTSERDIHGLDLSALYPSSINKAMGYAGSLTTPTCDEIVHHVVIPELLTMSSEQLTELRTLKLGSDPASGNVITQNWRNIQELNGRVIACYSSAFSLFLSPLLIAASLLYML